MQRSQCERRVRELQIRCRLVGSQGQTFRTHARFPVHACADGCACQPPHPTTTQPIPPLPLLVSLLISPVLSTRPTPKIQSCPPASPRLPSSSASSPPALQFPG
ncbi:hypothetical protein ZWY2020_042632 [Hordeum vulgare]|nr:hypothetical protein ZWY2020_042632 [Hordeum vulgare]